MTTRSGPSSLRSSAAPRARPPVLVAIAGGSGAGKSWLAKRLARRLHPHAGVLNLDHFYRDLSHLPPRQRDAVNFDAPEALDWETLAEALAAIRRGEAPMIPRYHFPTHLRKKRRVRWNPRPVTLVEGLWPWSRPEAASQYALRIFIDGGEETRFERRLDRDIRHRGRTPAYVKRQWRDQSEPMFLVHVAPQQRHADIVLGPHTSPQELDDLAGRIRRLAGLEAS